MAAQIYYFTFTLLLLCTSYTYSRSILLAQSEWIEINSPHFRVVSNAKLESAIDTTLQFERIRDAFHKALPEAKIDPGQEIVVFAVKDEASLKTLLPQYWKQPESLKPAGVFFPGPEKHYVALRIDARGTNPYRTLYHEYFHLILNINYPNIPLWLSEGLAEFYAHTRITDDSVALGLPSQNHLIQLRTQKLIPLKKLFLINQNSVHYKEAQKASIFYSQAWALTHYLMTSSKGTYKNQIDEILGSLLQGFPIEDVAEKVLGPLNKLEKNLARHIQKNEFTFYPYALPIDKNIRLSETKLSPAEAYALQASLLVRNNHPIEAKHLIDKALSIDPEGALAFESLGYLHYKEGCFSQAFNAFKQAVRLQISSYFSHYIYAKLALIDDRKAFTSWGKIESSLRKAINLRPNFPNSYETLARNLLDRGQNLEEALKIAVRAYHLNPKNIKTIEVLGYCFLSLGKHQQVTDLLESMKELAINKDDLMIYESLSLQVKKKSP